MAKRIETLADSPCYQCDMQDECIEKIRRSPRLMEICDAVIGNAEFDYHDCSLWNCLMIEMEGGDDKSRH